MKLTGTVVVAACLVALGAADAAADLPAGQMVKWGASLYGDAAAESELDDAVILDGNSSWALALRSDGSLYAWGSDQQDCVSDLPSGTDFVHADAGWYHGVAVRDDGSVVEWGSATTWQGWSTPTLTTAVEASGGDQHSAAVLSDGTLVTWGTRSSVTSQSGVYTDIVHAASGWYHVVALRENGTVVTFGEAAPGQDNTVPTGLSNVVQVAAGRNHSLALKSDGTVVCWGLNTSGQCDVPQGATNLVAVAGGRWHSLALKADGTVIAWGDGYYDEDEVPSGLENVVGIGCGYGWSMAIVGEPGLPVADAGNDQVAHDYDLNGSETVTLDGSGSSDSNGSITSWVWKEGETQIATGQTVQVSFSTGSHTITLIVTDNDSNTDSDTVIIDVNTPPVANAGNDQEVTDTDSSGSETVTLDGSGSSDSDGTVAGYLWKEGTTTLATTQTAAVSFAVGEHTVTLTVTDNDGATASDTLVVTVNAGSGGSETTLYPEADSEVRSGAYADDNYGSVDNVYVRERSSGTCNRAVFRFDLSSISGTVTDATLKLHVYSVGDDTSHRLYFMSDDTWVESTITWNNCPSTSSTTTTWSLTTADAGTWEEIDVTSLVQQELAGNEKLSVLVMADVMQNVLAQYSTREESGTTYDPQLVVTTGGGNQPPDADAGSDQVVHDYDLSGSETVTLDGSGSSDSDGTITSYVWKEGETQIATGQTAQVSLATGSHTITLTVTDDDSDTDSDTVLITVNVPPAADAGSDDSVTDTDEDGSETMTLDGSGSSDSDGSITSYVWKEGTTQIATGQTAQVSLAVGQHTITLTVTDDDGGTDSDDVVMTVNGDSTETTLYPEADSELRSGAYADDNYGSTFAVYVREQSSGTCNRAVFRFDLSSISGTVTDATLKLYAYSVTDDASHRLYFMSDDTWVESTITWNNCPSTSSTTTTWSLTTADAGTWKEIDVTSLVTQELAGNEKLSVLVMADTLQNVLVQYRTKEYSGTTYDPYLVVTTSGGESMRGGGEQLLLVAAADGGAAAPAGRPGRRDGDNPASASDPDRPGDDVVQGRPAAPEAAEAGHLDDDGLIVAGDQVDLAALLDEAVTLPAMRIRAELDRTWCYRNAPAATQDGHFSLLALDVQHDPYDNRAYAVWFEVTEGDAELVTIEPTGDPAVWRIVGAPAADAATAEGVPPELTVQVTVLGLESGGMGQARVTLVVRPLGDIDGDGLVGAIDQSVLNDCLDRQHVNRQAADECDLDADGAVTQADAELLGKIISGAPLE